MTNPQLIEFFKQRVGLCRHFADDRLDQLVKESHVVSYEPNEAIVEFGEDAGFLGVLLEGDLAVSVPSDGDQRQVISRFQAGDTFGEMALMSGDKTAGIVTSRIELHIGQAFDIRCCSHWRSDSLNGGSRFAA